MTADSRVRRPAKRSLGQNFLVDPNLQAKIVRELEADAEDAVLEIGPGHGELSALLVDRVAQLVLVEKDDELAQELAHRFASCGAANVVHGDALQLDLSSLLDAARPHRVLSNLPYSITTPLLFRILEMRPVPVRVVVTVQREVAERIVARPGSKSYGALSVGVQVQGAVRIAFRLGKKAFRPVPRVDSATVVIDPDPRLSTEAERAALRALTRVLFGSRRKQLQKILRTAPQYGLAPDAIEEVADRVGFDPRARPEVLTPIKFVELARVLAARR